VTTSATRPLTDAAFLSAAGTVRHRHIAVEGPIGVGKSSLAQRLADVLGYQAVLEQPEANPFLERFYRNPPDHALATQLFFLFQRSAQVDRLHRPVPAMVADFLLDRDRLFARANLDDDEFALYEQVYRQTALDAPAPDLVLYLQAPAAVLHERIQQRGTPWEQGIELAYLERINEAYSQFFLYYDAAPLLIVNAAEIDFAHSDRDFQHLVDHLGHIHSGRHYFNPTVS